MKTPRVVVVGGGISGLTLAFTLQEVARRLGAPLSLTVVEAGPRAGGHIRTTHADGFLVESGPNGFLNREPHTLALIDDLGLQSRLVHARAESRKRYIVRDGRLCAVPSGPVSLLMSSALSWAGKLRLLRELHSHQGATLEIDTELEPALHQDTGKPGHREHQRGNNERPFLAEKIEIRILE